MGYYKNKKGLNMDINKFISNFTNHPILFIGSGISMRYLNNSYTWDNLLKKINDDLLNKPNYYIDLKNKVYDNKNKSYNLPKLASILEEEINSVAHESSNELIKDINIEYYETMEKIHTSRLKIYISRLLKSLNYNNEKRHEIQELKKARKNIGSIITTNYDNLIEDIFEFNPLVGNNIILSNPYGSVYKIHGCVSKPESIIITNDDYIDFDNKYELIRAQLLSLFIHNPIIFLGYSISDDNIKKILETIFTYVSYDDDLAKKIRNNFLLVEYDKVSSNNKVIEHDIIINDVSIRINKIKTDDYESIYKSISNLRLPISTMDIRKVQSVVSDIYQGGKEDTIKVRVVEDLDNLSNSDKVLAIGSDRSIQYTFMNPSEIIENYFMIIENQNIKILEIIDKLTINSRQFFPIYAFSHMNENIERTEELKDNQLKKMKLIIEKMPKPAKKKNTDIGSILVDENLSIENKKNAIVWNVLEKNIKLEDLKDYLINYDIDNDKVLNESRNTTQYRKLVCIYDFCKYSKLNYSGDKYK